MSRVYSRGAMVTAIRSFVTAGEGDDMFRLWAGDFERDVFAFLEQVRVLLA